MAEQNSPPTPNPSQSQDTKKPGISDQDLGYIGQDWELRSGRTHFIDAFIRVRGSLKRKPELSLLLWTWKRKEKKKKNATAALRWKRCVLWCAPCDIHQSKLILSRVNKWYKHGFHDLQRLRSFTRSHLIPPPPLHRHHRSFFPLVKKVEKKGKH